MSETPSPAPAPPQQSVSVRVQGLRKSYDGAPVLKGIDFEVRRGEIFVIMGPSGSGKSVLLKHIIGLEPPDEGDIFIEGESVRAEGGLDQRKQLAFLEADVIVQRAGDCGYVARA